MMAVPFVSFKKGNGDIGVKLAQLEIRRVKDMAVVIVIGTHLPAGFE
jgi:hypothetical protein